MVKNTRLRVGAFFRWDGSLVYSLGVVTTLVPMLTQAQAIRVDGRTATTVSVNGAVTDVRTNSIQGGNAFNSFSTFNVPAATVTNLHVPTSVSNLINVVRDERSNIHGVLNAVKDGSVGGKLWFVNPYGLVVGSAGSVNVGNLSVVTATPQFVNGFFESTGFADPASLSSLLAGNAPINAGGLVSIQGKVNAIAGVNVAAGTVNVDGTVFAGAHFTGAAPDLSDVVNVNGISSASNVLVEGGRIRIVAQDDVTVSGTLATPGAAGVKGGDINIHAGGNVAIEAGAQLVARGNGAQSDGGTIMSWADQKAVNRTGSLLDASAGASGAGGSVEFSAKQTVELAGGELRADGTGGGAAGSVLVDPANIVVSANMLRGDASYASGGGVTVNGADITLQADESIVLDANVLISSRAVSTDSLQDHQSSDSKGNSGNITLKAPSIVLKHGSSLDAHATGAYAAGDISLLAEKKGDTSMLVALGVRDASASIQVGDELGGATVRGRKVNLTASTVVESTYHYPTGEPVIEDIDFSTIGLEATSLGVDAAKYGLSLLGVNVVNSQSTGAASVDVRGTANQKSLIEGTTGVTLSASNDVKAGVSTMSSITPSVVVPTPLGLGALYVSTEATATVQVQADAVIKGKDLTVSAHNNASAEGSINAGSPNNSSDRLSIAFGYVSSSVDASATIAKGALIKSTGDVSVLASNDSKQNNEVQSVTGPNGQASAAVAWSDHNTNARASLLSDVLDARQVHVVAVDHVLSDQTSASASAGTSPSDRLKNAFKQATVQGVEDYFLKTFRLTTQKIDERANALPTPFRVGGAIAYVDSVHQSSAVLGAGANVHVSDADHSGAVLVASRTIGADTSISAETSTATPSTADAGRGETGSASKINVAAGLAIGHYQHHANAVVETNAVVTADKVAVSSDVSMPIRKSILFGNADWNFDRWDGVTTFTEAMDTLDFLNVLNGKSSAKVLGSTDPASLGFSGSANLLTFSHSSRSEVQAGAQLNVREGASGGFAYQFTLRDATADKYVPYTSILVTRGEAADVQGWQFEAPVTVQAHTAATLLFQAGAPKSSIGESNKAIGFSFSQIEVSSDNEALVREGAKVRGVSDSASSADEDGVRTWTLSATDKWVDDVRISADSADMVVSLGLNAGTSAAGGNSFALNGMMSLLSVDNQTVASVDDEVSLNARALSIKGHDGTVAWSLAGAIDKSVASVGIGLAINDVTTDTRSEIADNDAYATDGARVSQLDKQPVDAANAAIKAADLQVEARTGGRVEAVAIAGALSSTDNSPPGSGLLAKAKAARDQFYATATQSLLKLDPNTPTRARSNATTTKPAPSAAPTYGFSGAGSAAVNTTEITTTARIDSSAVESKKISLLAVSDSDITAGSGAGARTKAENSNQTQAVGISGAVAINLLGNATESVIKGAAITGAQNVSVNALTGGEHLAVGIGATTVSSGSNAQQDSTAFAGSVSYTESLVDADGKTRDRAVASVENSTVTGDGSETSGLSVQAYNRTFIGTGGGSLSAGGKTGVGAAVTYSDIRSDVSAAISGSTISQFQDATVRAYNATEIAAGGAMGAYSGRTDSQSLAGAFVLTQVQNNTSATINGKSSVTVAKAIQVRAEDGGAVDEFETIIDKDDKRHNVAADLDYCGQKLGSGGTTGNSCITSVAGLVQSNTGSGSSNLGVSVVQNLIGNTTSAQVENAVLKAGDSTSGKVSVLADSSTELFGLAIGVGSANQLSGAGSVVINQTENKVSASVTAPLGDANHQTITAHDILVKATDASKIQSGAGQLSISKNSAVGGAIAYSDIDNSTIAKADGVKLNAKNALQIEAAQNKASIKTLAVAGALGEWAATASIAVNQITNKIDAQLLNTTTADGANGTNAVMVKSRDDSSIQALAGNVTVGAQAGGGAAFAHNAIDNETLSQVSQSTLTEVSYLDVLAYQDASIQSLTAGLGVSGGGALAGSASTNFISNDTTAQMEASNLTGSSADVAILGYDTSSIEAASGGAAVSTGSEAAGIAASVNRIANTADAHVSQGTTMQVKNLTIDARSDATIETVAVAMGAAKEVGIGGSNATNLMDNATRAYIATGADVQAKGNVGVFAQNEDKVKVIAGALGGSTGAAAAGLSVVVNIMDGSTDAHIDGSTTKVDAAGEEVAQLSVNSGDVANPQDVSKVLSPSYAHADLSETKRSLKGLAVTATSHQSVITNAASLGVAAGPGVGVGLVPVVNILSGATKAYIDSASIDTRLTSFAAPDVYVNASSHSYAGNFVLGASGSADGAATGAVSTNLMDRKTYAYISDATTGGVVEDTQVDSVVTGGGYVSIPVDFGNGVTASKLVPAVTTITQSKRLLPSLGKVTVHANATQKTASLVEGFALSGASFAGTGVVNRFGADTQAHVDNGTLTASSLSVEAQTSSGYNAQAGAGAVGGHGAVTGSFAVGLLNNSTKAWVGDASAQTNTTVLKLTGDLDVAANTSNVMNSLVISASGAGGVGVAGMADVSLLNNTTQAAVYRTTAGEKEPTAVVGTAQTTTTTYPTAPTVTTTTTTTTTDTVTHDYTQGNQLGRPMGAVNVHANEDVNLTAEAGVGSLGGTAGVGAGANVVIVKSQVTAEVDRSTLYTPKGVSVTANATKAVKMVTATAGAGGTAGIGAAAGVLLIGDGTAADANNEINKDGSGTVAQVDQATRSTPDIGDGTGLTDNERSTKLGNRATFSTASLVGSNAKDAVTARITSSTVTSDAVKVQAQGAVSSSNTVGAGAVGGTVGVGGAVGFTRVYDNITAQATDVTLNAPQVQVTALMQDHADKAVAVQAYAGAAGLVGLGAGVADGDINNTVTATLGGTVTGQAGNSDAVLVQAQDLSSMQTEGVGAAAGAAAVGVVVSTATKNSTVTAQTLDGSVLTQFNSMDIAATESGAVKSKAIAAAGGVYAGNGAGATAKDQAKVAALVMGTLAAAQKVKVAAQATPEVYAQALGTVLGAVGAGASVALADAAPTVTASVGNDAIINGTGALVVNAGVNTPASGAPTAKAEALAAAGGTLVGANATVASANSKAAVDASVGDGAILPAGHVAIKADNNTVQEAHASGASLGGLALGANTAISGSEGTTQAWLGKGKTDSSDAGSPKSTASGRTGDVSIVANGVDSNHATALSGAGGLYAGNAATASTSDTATTTAWMAGEAGKKTTVYGGQFVIKASHEDVSGRSASSVNASAIGASGAVATHTANSNVQADIGDSLNLKALGVVEVEASNAFKEDQTGSTAQGAAGGGISGAAVISRTELTGSTNTAIGSQVDIQSGTDPLNNSGGITFTASTTASGGDQVTLDTGGAITGAGVESSYKANLANKVAIGRNTILDTLGNIGVGTWTITTDVSTQALVNTWGVASVGSANASTDINANDQVTVAADGSMTAFGNINLTAGKDPLGKYDTALSGSSDAQGYVRGIIAIPTANANTTLASDASVTVGAGEQIKSGQNVVMGAYSGTPRGMSTVDARGYQLGFIPVSGGTRNLNTPTTSNVDFNGEITAGIYHQLDITINGNTLTSNAGAAPFLYGFNSKFNAPDYVNSHFTGTEAQLLGSNVSQTNVGAFELGALYASGGTATIHADAVSGNGTVTSYGSPTISVVNNSKNYLLLNEVNIPNLPGGQVMFTGGAGSDQVKAEGWSIQEVGGSQTPSVTIKNTYDGTVGDGQFGPALFLGGNISNLGGGVLVRNLSGSLGQTGAIYGQQVNIDVPKGALVVSSTEPYYPLGGNPISEWQNYMIWPGGDPSKAVPNADEAITYVANAKFNSDGKYTTDADLTRAIIGQAGSTTENYSYVFFGSCLFGGQTTGDCSPEAARSASPVGKDFSVSPRFGGSFAVVPVRTLTKTGSSTNANYTGSQQSQIKAAQVSINAKFIDVNGKISVGTPTSWSLYLPKSLEATLTQFKDDYDSGKTNGQSDYVISPQVAMAGDQPINAVYHAKTNEIEVSDVQASSGGGYLGLTGRIMSTNTFGNIEVTGGLGDVVINNQTGLALKLNKINTGNTAHASGMVSQVEIIDFNYALQNGHWLYQYTPGNSAGSGLKLYKGAAQDSKQQLLSTQPVTIAGNTTTHEPKAGMRWTWNQTADLHRDATVDRKNGLATVGNWTFVCDQTQPWLYTNEEGTPISTKPLGYLTYGQTDTNEFSQKITGTTNNAELVYNQYGGCDSNGSCNYDFSNQGVGNNGDGRARWYYSYQRDATLNLTSSVNASHPFGITFKGIDYSQVNVSSTASVTINGDLVSPNGFTSIFTKAGDISQSATGTVLTKQLILTAPGAIGSANSALSATLIDNGELFVDGGSKGVYLDLNSGALVDSVVAKTDDVYGDVKIHAANSLTAMGTGKANVVGNNITLISDQGSIGSEAAPMLLNANTDQPPGGIGFGIAPIVGTPGGKTGSSSTSVSNPSTLTGGVVNVSALKDVAITQYEGDLRVGSIASTGSGDVFVNVPKGTLYGAEGQTSAQVLSDKQIKEARQTLRLTEAYGAEKEGDASAASVTRFQDQVNSRYQQYWRMLAQGSVTGEDFTLSTNSMPLYRSLAAAKLGVANPTDAQVQDYAGGQFKAITGALSSMLGAGWQQVVGTSVDNSFAYKATVDQVTALTKNAVWTDAELNAAIKVSALKPGTPVGVGSPNLTGRNVKLTTSGAIGKQGTPVTITLADLQAGKLSDDELAALASAYVPGSVVGVYANGQQPFTPNGVPPTAFQVQQTAPVFVKASGTFTAQAGKQTYVQSAAPNITLDQIVAGGDVSVIAPQNIASAGNSTAITTPGDVTLLAGSGSIGSISQPLQVQAARLLAASAGQDAYLRVQNANADFVFGRVAAGGTASLDASSGSLLSSLDGVNVTADQIILNAKNDMGAVSRYVQLDVGAEGVAGGHAGGAAYIGSADATKALHIDSFSADAGLTIAAAGDLTAQTLQSGQGAVNAAAGGHANLDEVIGSNANVTLTAAGDLTVGTVTGSDGKITLQAGQGLTVNGLVSATQGAISATGDAVDIAGQLISQAGAIDVNARGNVYVNGISSGKEIGRAITINSTDGRIVEAGSDADADIVANGFNTTVSLNARDGVGDATRTGKDSVDTTQANALEVKLASLTANSAQGGIQLNEVDGLIVDTVTAHDAVVLKVAGNLRGGSYLSTASAVELAGAEVRVTGVSAATSAKVSATKTGLRLSNVTAGNEIALQSQTGLVAGTLKTTGQGHITATTASGDLNASAVDSAGAVSLTASAGNVKVNTVQGAGDVSLTAAKGIAGNSAARYSVVESLAGDVTLKANGADIMGGRTQAAGDLLVQTSGLADLTATHSGGQLTINAATINAATATAAAADISATSGALQVGSTTAGTMNLQAQTGLVAGSLKTTGQGGINAQTAGGDLQVSSIDAAGAVSLAATAGNVKVDTVQGAGDVALTAAKGIAGNSAARYSVVESLAGDVTLKANGADIMGGRTQAAGDLLVQTSGLADLTATHSGGQLTINAATINAATATAAVADISATSGALQVGSTTAGTMNLQAQTGLVAGSLKTTGQGGITAQTAGGDLQVSSIDAAGAVSLAATAGNVKVDTVQGAGDVALTAAKGIEAETLNSVVGRVSAIATSGDLNVKTTHAQLDARLESAGNIVVSDVTSSQGHASLLAQRNISGKRVSALRGTAKVTAANGQLQVNDIGADGVQLSSQGAIKADQINVGSRLTVSGQDVDASVHHTSLDAPLQLTFVGGNHATMDQVKLKLDSQVGINIEQLQAVDAHLDVSNGALGIADGFIGKRLTVVNPVTTLVMDNNDVREQKPFDLQLFSRSKSFSLSLDRNILRTQGADIVHRNAMETIVLDATTGGQSSSVAEQSMNEVVHAIQVIQPVAPKAAQMTASLLDISASPVQLMDIAPNQNNNNDDLEDQ